MDQPGSGVPPQSQPGAEPGGGAYQPPQQPYQPPQQPYQPPQQPYQPPPQAYQAPQAQYQPPPTGQYQPPQAGYPPTPPPGMEQPYQQPGYPPAGYQPVPPPPPVEKRKGFNWLACCGISCVVLLIVGGLVGFCTYRFMQPFIAIGMGIAKVAEVVQNTDEATIIGAAVPLTTADLAADPHSYKDQWLAVSGVVQSSGGGMQGTNFSSGSFNSDETTPYFLSDNVLVMDVTNTPAVGTTGDTVVAYGQIYVMDLEELKKMPFFGPAVMEELKKDPQFQGNLKMIFVVAKKVVPAGGSPADIPPPDFGTEQPPADDTGAGGWIN